MNTANLVSDIGDAVFVEGRYLVYAGSHSSDRSKYPVSAFLDITDSLKIRLELQDFGTVNYPLSNLRASCITNKSLRQAVRNLEDYITERFDKGFDLKIYESQFVDWMLGR